jgi:hypothetical protein
VKNYEDRWKEGEVEQKKEKKINLMNLIFGDPGKGNEY